MGRKVKVCVKGETIPLPLLFLVCVANALWTVEKQLYRGHGGQHMKKTTAAMREWQNE